MITGRAKTKVKRVAGKLKKGKESIRKANKK
jgi:hypothetical protein